MSRHCFSSRCGVRLPLRRASAAHCLEEAKREMHADLEATGVPAKTRAAAQRGTARRAT